MDVIRMVQPCQKQKLWKSYETKILVQTAVEKAQRRKDAKKLLEAVEKRFGGNAATRKTQRNLLKQQYENFTSPSSEMLDQTFDRLPKACESVMLGL
ncbi:hypothetical protein Tco_1316521 [Tanacetum coccineum]